MSRQGDTFERLSAANPVPEPSEPEWEPIAEHARRAEEEHPRATSAGRHRTRPRRRLLAGLALATAAATGLLIAIAPWSGGESFLARATAALTPPGPGFVLYERWEHVIGPEPGNPLRTRTLTIGPDQLWIDGRSPHRYRAILAPGGGAPARSRSGGEGLVASYGVSLGFSGGFTLPHGENSLLNRVRQKLSGRSFEIGGSIEDPHGRALHGTILPTLTFLPPDELLWARLKVTLGATLLGPHDTAIEDGADPVGVLRSAIAEGRAHETGTARLDGRAVQRISLEVPTGLPADAPPLPADAPPMGHGEAYADVEPGTLHPVQIVFGGEIYRFLAYEYLPATAANLALADIRAQHPHATVHDVIATVRSRQR